MINEPRLYDLWPSDEKDFRINFEIIYNHDIPQTENWHEHPAVITMAEIILKREGPKDIEELYKEMLSRVVESQANDAFYKSPLDNHDRKQMRYILSNEVFHGQFFYIYSHRYFGVSLDRKIELNPGDNGFTILFAYRFSKTKQRLDFLNHHLEKSFKKNPQSFQLFLREVTEHLSPNEKKYIEDYIDLDFLKPTLKKETSPTTVAYMVLFLERSGDTRKQKDLFKHYQDRFRPELPNWVNTIKTTHQEIKNSLSSESQTLKNESFIKEAIDLLEENLTDAKKIGRRLLKERAFL